ncbi:hypothetical protein B0H17DRAFT_1207697 [Mycena rosella]|uniref:Transmembrane protein n=1 Tax=Mycena rosella TaxID=1033263 RepID=A0AAD7D2M8_MYCRO|nr:hypothetical protein B0H17DRAFT_1207697 [Mycena rosella]
MGLLCYVLSHPLRQKTNAGLYRGLGDLLGGGDENPLIPSPSEPEMDTALPQPHHLTIIPSEGLGGLFTVAGNKGSSIQATAPSASRTISTLDLTAPNSQSTIATTTSPSTNIPSPTMTTGVTKQAPSMPPAEAAQWKVIGIASVGIGLVAAVMLSIVYFDSWWGFLRALVGKKRKEGGTEDLVPDWARRDWEFKIASEDGHRYPTPSSLEFMAKPKQDPAPVGPLMSVSPDPRHLIPMRPPSLYIPTLDPHPLEALFRRPSASSYLVPHDPISRA